MKPFLTLLCLCSLSASLLNAQNYRAQSPKTTKYAIQRIEHPNHILLSPFYLFDGTFMLSYERLFQTGALRITPSVTLRNRTDYNYNHNYDNREEQGWTIDLGYKFFFTNRVHRVTPYVGPYAFYRYLESKIQYPPQECGPECSTPALQYSAYTNYDILGVGVEGGVKFIFGRFTMDVSLGGGIRIPYRDGDVVSNGRDGMWDIAYKGVVARGNFSFGITF